MLFNPNEQYCEWCKGFHVGECMRCPECGALMRDIQEQCDSCGFQADPCDFEDGSHIGFYSI